MNEKELLESLLPAICSIDSGCSHCIGDFVEKANYRLSLAGSQYFLMSDPDDGSRVSVTELNEAVELILAEVREGRANLIASGINPD